MPVCALSGLVSDEQCLGWTFLEEWVRREGFELATNLPIHS